MSGYSKSASVELVAADELLEDHLRLDSAEVMMVSPSASGKPSTVGVAFDRDQFARILTRHRADGFVEQRKGRLP